MPWKEETVMSQKEIFIAQVLAEEKSFKQLCIEYKISRQTGYALLKRYQAEGPRGLQVRSRRPHFSPRKTAHEMEEKILTVRVQHPTWGARLIREYLARRGVENLPAPSTISEILKRSGFVLEEESLKRQAFIRFERENPNDLWQMDFKGHIQLATKKTCYPLTIIDDHSRFSLCIKACENEQYLPVKQHLINIFEQYGLPLQLNVDNGNPWGNSKLLPHTKLTVWLMQLGIRVTHSRPRHPQTNGKIERFHRTLKQDVLSHQTLFDFEHAQIVFDGWRHLYNYERPHQAIDMQVPAQRYRPSIRPLPDKLSPIEYSDDAIIRKVRGNGYIRYRNKEYLIGEAFVGHNIEIKHLEVNAQIKMYFGKHKIYTYDLD